MRKLVLLGARGMFGRDAVPILDAAGWDVEGFDLPEADITDGASLSKILDASGARVVLNAAAYTDVDGAEAHAEEAFRANASGVRTLAEACRRRGIFLVHLSTDYVYPGDRPEGYPPSHPPGPPANSYGASKLAGEVALRETLPPDRFLVCRTQWLYGRHGKNFVDTIRGLAARPAPLKVVDDQWGVPTHTGELARQILGCLGEGRTGIAHTVGGGGPITWFTFAEAVVSLLGLSCCVEPCSSGEFPRPARRPRHAWLSAGADHAGGARHWRESLENYLVPIRECRKGSSEE